MKNEEDIGRMNIYIYHPGCWILFTIPPERCPPPVIKEILVVVNT
jgi:hypothetical protein